MDINFFGFLPCSIATLACMPRGGQCGGRGGWEGGEGVVLSPEFGPGAQLELDCDPQSRFGSQLSPSLGHPSLLSSIRLT